MADRDLLDWAKQSLAKAKSEGKADGAFARAVREYLEAHDDEEKPTHNKRTRKTEAKS